MEDVVPEATTTKTLPPKSKGGRPKRNPVRMKKSQNVSEITPTIDRVPTVANNEWPTKRAARIRIQRNVEEGEECIFQLGDSPLLIVRRNVEVIVPWDVIGILNDMVVDMPRCHLEPHKPPVYYTEKVTRAEYSFLGEVSWQEYLNYRDAQRKLK